MTKENPQHIAIDKEDYLLFKLYCHLKEYKTLIQGFKEVFFNNPDVVQTLKDYHKGSSQHKELIVKSFSDRNLKF